MSIVVVGAGIVGCAVAHELASRGARVRVVDERGVGQGATRASAGMLAPAIEGHSEALLQLGLNSLALYDRFIQRVEEDGRQCVEYGRNGTLQVACDDAERAVLEASARNLERYGIEHTVLDGAAARRLEPRLSDQTKAAVLVPRHGYVRVSELMGVLAAAAVSRGAEFVSARVTGLDEADCVHVRTTSGEFRCDAAVVAAGSWSSSLLGGTAVAVKPIRGQLVRLSMEKAAPGAVVWGSQCYLVPWRDGSVLVGASSEDVGFDERSTAAAVERLLAAAIGLMPALKSAQFNEVRVGLRPATSDELPAIGASSTMPHVYLATGHYRNGVLLAPLTAQLVADLMLEGRGGPQLAHVRPDRLGL